MFLCIFGGCHLKLLLRYGSMLTKMKKKNGKTPKMTNFHKNPNLNFYNSLNHFGRGPLLVLVAVGVCMDFRE